MWPGNRMKTGTCPCCKVCKNCPGFQKVLDRPDSGFILYRHITHVEDINKKTGVIEATTDTIDDVFIIENTQGAALKKIDLTPEIDRNQISCPRCVNILKHAQSLFKNQEIGDSDVTGVCEHCRQKSQRERSCLKCDEIVEKFHLSKNEGKQTRAQRVKTWLSKVQQLITLALDEEKGKKTGSPIKRGHSDIDISKLFRNVLKTEHEPEIEDLFLQNIRELQSAIKGPASERSYFPGAIKGVAFYDPDETKPIYGTPQDGVQSLLHSQSNATLTEDELEKDFIRKYGKSYKEKRLFEDPTARVRYLDERYNEFIPPFDISYDDEDYMAAPNKHGRKRENILDSDSRHGGIRGKDQEDEYIPDSDARHEGVRTKKSITDSDSQHEGGKRKDQAPEGTKYREDDRNKDFIPAPKSRHEEEKKKAGMRRDDETPDEIKKRVTRDTKKDDFITVKGKRFEEEIGAKGLTLAPKKSQDTKKRKVLTTASETQLELGRDHKIGKKAKSGTKILSETPSRIKKYHSDESLIAGISKIKEEMKRHKTFELYFPEKPGACKKKPKIGSDEGSAELIKDTINILKTKKENEKSMREQADEIKGEREKKLEQEKLDRERLIAEKMAAKLAREAEREQKEKEKGIESEVQDTSKKGQEASSKGQNLPKIDKDLSKKDQDLYKKEQDLSKKKQYESKKDRDLSKKDHDASKIDPDAFRKEQDASKKDRDGFERDKDVSKKDQGVTKKNNDDEMIKEKSTKDKIGKEKEKKGVNKKGKERNDDITMLKIEKGKETKSKDEDQFKGAKIKAKEEKYEDKTKEKKVKGKEVNITENKDKGDKEKEMKFKKDKEVKLKDGTTNKQTLTTNKRDPEAEKLLKQLEQETKEREKLQQELRQQKEEERRIKAAAEQKAKEAANQLVKKEKKIEPATKKPEISKPRSKAKILSLIVPCDKAKEKIKSLSPIQIKMHGQHREIKQKSCALCNDSDLELDLQNLLKQKQEELKKKHAVKEAVIGEKILKFKTQMPGPQMEEGIIEPILFQKQIEILGQEIDYSQLNLVPEPEPEVKPKHKGVSYH